MMKVPLSRPYKTENAIEYIRDVISSPYISSGPYIKRFEEYISKISGAKYAVSCSSGTAGLHLAVKALGIGDGDEVITTPYSFIATSNVILYERAMPVFCDVEPEHLNLSYERVKECIEKTYIWHDGALKNRYTGRILKAIMPVHIYGYPADMKGFIELAEKYNLKVIEDSAEALGSYISINGRMHMAGTIGDAGIYAFYANKQITTGEGGVVVTNNVKIRDYVLSVRNQGRSLTSSWLVHEKVGYNYRMSALNAALGLSQLEHLPEIVSKRREAFKRYEELLREVDEIELFREEDGVKTNWFVFVIRFRHMELRDKVMNYLRDKGIETRPYFDPPLHLQPVYKNILPYKRGDFPVAEEASKRVLALPFFTGISHEEQIYVVKTLKQGIVKVA